MTFRTAIWLGLFGVLSLPRTGVPTFAADTPYRGPRIVAHRGASAERPENTLAALQRAIEVGADAVEIDVRTSKDGALFLLHDASLDRTTDGQGPASEKTIAELRALDAGSWFHHDYRGQRIPLLREALELCRGKIDVVLDLKEQGDAYADAVVRAVVAHGDPRQTIFGVHSVQQARRFRTRLPAARQLGFIPTPGQIEAIAQAGVETIRLWPQWLDDPALVPQVRRLGARLQLNGATGEPPEVLPLLRHRPDAVLVDAPATLRATLAHFEQNAAGVRGETAPFSYAEWSLRERPLAAARFTTRAQLAAWQEQRRGEFLRRLVFPYGVEPTIRPVGQLLDRGRFGQQEFEVCAGDRRLFRFFRLTPRAAGQADGGAASEPHGQVAGKSPARLPAVVCFMGHGKVQQILADWDSYQHACAAEFAERGYLVFAMENVGMEPDRDGHRELDRLLRLDGYCWYSLLFAHQRMLLDHVFADPQVDAKRTGVVGVSTGGLLALTAAALDPRVAAASVQGIFGSMRVSFIRDRQRHCPCGAIPGLLPNFDLPDLALLVAPRPLHIANAAGDGFSPQEAKRCIELIAPVYAMAGGARPEFTSLPGGHELALQPAVDFFRVHLAHPDPPGRKPVNHSRRTGKVGPIANAVLDRNQI